MSWARLAARAAMGAGQSGPGLSAAAAAPPHAGPSRPALTGCARGAGAWRPAIPNRVSTPAPERCPGRQVRQLAGSSASSLRLRAWRFDKPAMLTGGDGRKWATTSPPSSPPPAAQTGELGRRCSAVVWALPDRPWRGGIAGLNLVDAVSSSRPNCPARGTAFGPRILSSDFAVRTGRRRLPEAASRSASTADYEIS